VIAPFTDEDFPAVPYPGARPGCSFVHLDGTGHPLRPDPAALSGWRVRADGRDLDEWLADVAAAPLAQRVPVLAYGSNACPAKVTWLRGTVGLAGPVVMLRASCVGIAAVWASGLRIVDDQRPATLAAAPAVREEHAVWLATPDQVRVLDVCEGRGSRYHLVRLGTGEVRLDDGARLDRVLAYTGAAERRRPLLVNSATVRCAEVEQHVAVTLRGRPASTDGLAGIVLDGEPVPADYPGRLFVYGTLQPSARAWRLLEPMVDGRPWPARTAGALYDTGLGYPALRLGDGPGVSGWVVELRTPSAALSAMDAYEGPEYRRVRITLPDGTMCWTYVWIGAVDGMRLLTRQWPA
jgi:gamma-glutamylcyclotransferase (GGCT)/AIG2-like uncharacterized protein YtfP